MRVELVVKGLPLPTYSRLQEACAEGSSPTLGELCALLAQYEPGLAGVLLMLAIEEDWFCSTACCCPMPKLVRQLLKGGAPAGWTDGAGW